MSAPLLLSRVNLGALVHLFVPWFPHPSALAVSMQEKNERIALCSVTHLWSDVGHQYFVYVVNLVWISNIRLIWVYKIINIFVHLQFFLWIIVRKARSFSSSSLGSRGGNSWSRSFGSEAFFTVRQHTCASLLGGGESCWVAPSATQLFWVKWSLPTDLLSCWMCLLPSFLELLQLFLEGDPVERGCYGPGTAGIFNDLSAAHSQVPTPRGNDGGGGWLRGGADCTISWKPLLKFSDVVIERLAG